MAKLAIAIGFAILGALTFGLGALAGIGVLAGTSSAILGASIGFAVGGIVGGLLFPTRLPDQYGPRLNDLTVSSSTNGAPIPIGYGTFRFAGNIIWSPGLVEHTTVTKTSTKGGPSYSTTTYTYTASFAVAFGEGPGTVIKVWFDSKIGYDDNVDSAAAYDATVVYDVGAVVAYANQLWVTQIVNGPGTDGGVLAPNSGANKTIGGVVTYYWILLTIKYPPPVLYPGNNAQMPDPTIQSYQGVNVTTAYRGIIYGVWTDLLLTDFGNRIPNIQGLVKFAIGTSDYARLYRPPVIV